jgi:hypothetical protein
MSSVKITELTSSGPLTGSEVLPIVQGNQTVKTTAQDIANLAGGGLEGTQYVYVAANGTDIENAAELQAAYNTAKTMSPSATNRITIIAGPGKYEFNNSNPFTLDTGFIDLISLTGEIDVILYTTNANNNPTVRENIIINNNNIIVKGIDASKEVWQYASKGNFLEKGSFNISNNLNNLICKNCIGGANSFGGNGGTASGTFNNCISGSQSFGGIGGTASGTFTDCVAGGGAFAIGGTASGTFNNCISGNESFGANGTASGTFNNCISGNESFGGNGGTLSGKLYYCRLTLNTFQTVSGGGRTYYCVDGNGNPNNQ